MSNYHRYLRAQYRVNLHHEFNSSFVLIKHWHPLGDPLVQLCAALHAAAVHTEEQVRSYRQAERERQRKREMQIKKHDRLFCFPSTTHARATIWSFGAWPACTARYTSQTTHPRRWAIMRSTPEPSIASQPARLPKGIHRSCHPMLLVNINCICICNCNCN